MPMEARFESGFSGFSVNFTMRPSSGSAVMMPKRLASSHGTGMTETVRSALCWMWLSSILR